MEKYTVRYRANISLDRFVTHVQSWGVEQDVHGVHDVGRVQAVVVGHLGQVVGLDGQEERHTQAVWNLEDLQEVPLLR